MPNYDYECQTCGQRFEVFQSMNDAKLQDCPAEGCEGKVKRLLGTGAGLIFKGAGFYQTDYRSSSYQDGAKKEKSSTEAAAKPAKEGGGENPKPAPAPAAKPGSSAD